MKTVRLGINSEGCTETDRQTLSSGNQVKKASVEGVGIDPGQSQNTR